MMYRKRLPLQIFKRYNNNSNSSSGSSWKILRLNHIAIASKAIEESSILYRDKFQMITSDKHAQPDHGVNTMFVDCGNTKIELLDPIANCKSPIENFLDKNPTGGIHHLCFEVDDLEAACNDLRQRGLRLLSERPKIGAHGKPVIFCHPKDCSGVLIELEQA
ncbi:methylmalonyl-coa epimerase [Dermatophagoides farinae]|uniref:Methylmalonyl-CoA epimerase, mitochondrial n=2 Tax=Dermatophagoides farinae TaxID=6954 RepID=A0A9D4NRU0_DERFA|nr:methylmalonyl-coa epimerase [Dermatophagoides farinae]